MRIGAKILLSICTIGFVHFLPKHLPTLPFPERVPELVPVMLWRLIELFAKATYYLLHEKALHRYP